MTSDAFERIDISGCDPGIYALIIETNGETINAKVVKKD
jgi:hypothetical protein